MLVHVVDVGVVGGRMCQGVALGEVGGGCVVRGGKCSGMDVRMALMRSWSLIVRLMRE